MKIFCLFSQSSLRNKKIIESWWSFRLLKKVIHVLYAGNYDHFEIGGAKSKLLYMVS